MFKKLIFCFLALATIAFVSCEAVKEAIPDLSITPTFSTGTIDVNAMTAGQKFEKEITISSATATDALKAAGGTVNLVKKAVVTGFELVLPTTATWSFTDITSIEATLDGTSIGTFPGVANGKTATFTIPANQADLKASILNGAGFKVKLSITAKNATTATSVTGNLKTKIDFSL